LALRFALRLKRATARAAERNAPGQHHEREGGASAARLRELERGGIYEVRHGLILFSGYRQVAPLGSQAPGEL